VARSYPQPRPAHRLTQRVAQKSPHRGGATRSRPRRARYGFRKEGRAKRMLVTTGFAVVKEARVLEILSLAIVVSALVVVGAFVWWVAERLSNRKGS